TLDPIGEERGRPEEQLWAEFERERPRMLGVLLDAVAHGLRRLPAVQLGRHPRMADFARWVTACETAVWSPGTFMAAYDGNRDEAIANVSEADAFATAVCSFMSIGTQWSGTATDLLGGLVGVVGERVAKSKTWPGSPRALSGRVRRAATPLRKIGIVIAFDKDSERKRTRLICIQKTDGENRPDRPHRPNPPDINPLPSDGPADDTNDRLGATVRGRPPKSNGADGVDGADANFASS